MSLCIVCRSSCERLKHCTARYLPPFSRGTSFRQHTTRIMLLLYHDVAHNSGGLEAVIRITCSKISARNRRYACSTIVNFICAPNCNERIWRIAIILLVADYAKTSKEGSTIWSDIESLAIAVHLKGGIWNQIFPISSTNCCRDIGTILKGVS